ncbi:MAG: hypothetical protein V7768_01295, partial [Dietzia cercidiphylli]
MSEVHEAYLEPPLGGIGGPDAGPRAYSVAVTGARAPLGRRSRAPGPHSVAGHARPRAAPPNEKSVPHT